MDDIDEFAVAPEVTAAVVAALEVAEAPDAAPSIKVEVPTSSGD